MEINITQFFNDCEPGSYSASCLELGANAGNITWGNAMQAAAYRTTALLDTAEKLQAMRNWARSSGGWNDVEIAAWDATELNALFIQLVAGDMREKDDMSWDEYQVESEAGQVSGSLFEGIDKELYYQLEG